MDGPITYKAAPTLAKFHASDAFVRGIIGPIGSGKSSAAVVEVIQRAMRQEPGPDGVRRTRVAIIRNSYRELKDTTLATFRGWVPPEIVLWREVDMSLSLKFNDINCEILFRALDRPDDVKKLLSLELTFAWVNEAKEIPRSVIDMLQGRVGRYPALRDGGPTWSGIIMDTNPPDNDGWWFKLFEEDRPEGWEIWRQPSGLSPEAENIANLPENYYQRLMPGKSQEWIDIFVHGNYGFTVDGKPIYPEYNDVVHSKPGPWKPTPGIPIQVGIDFGLTPAAVLGQAQPSGQMVWFDELVTEEMGAVRFGEQLGQLLRGTYPGFSVNITGDPAGDHRSQVDERTPYDVLHAAGLMAQKASTNDFELRRSSVVVALQRMTMAGDPGLILIGPQVPMLRKGMMGGYAYKRIQVSGRERYHDKPDKNIYSHVAEAGQYLMDGAGLTHKVLDGVTRQRAPRVNASMGHGRRRGKHPAEAFA